MWICIARLAPRREHTFKALRYGTRSQFYRHAPRSSANGMNHTCLCLPSWNWYWVLTKIKHSGKTQDLFPNVGRRKTMRKINPKNGPGARESIRSVIGTGSYSKWISSVASGACGSNIV